MALLASSKLHDESSAAVAAGASGSDDAATGFNRPDMYKSPLVGSVSLYQRHVFVCYKDALSWPSILEGAQDLDDLPRRLFAAFKARKKDMPSKVRLTMCESGSESPDGDILVFPDLVRYRGVSAGDAERFVEAVMVKESVWNAAGCERENVSRGRCHVFICAHGSRDARCGSCGPVLIQKFRAEVARRGLQAQVAVKACSHIGGHKFAGNVIIFAGDPVAGHWYGYVTPQDVSVLLEEHVQKGRIVDRLWRGQMCLSEEEQRQSQLSRQVGEPEQEDSQCCPCGLRNAADCGRSDKNGVLPKSDLKEKKQVKSISNLIEEVEIEDDVKISNIKSQRASCRGLLRWLLLEGWWKTEDKVTATSAGALVVLGAATVIGICYYYYGYHNYKNNNIMSKTVSK